MNKQLFESALNMNRSLTALLRCVHWPQGGSRKRQLLAVIVLTLCLGTSGLALINDTFYDVPASAFYHDAVNAIYRAGITAGCSAGLYCPDQAVTRAQTAVFLQRGLSRVAYNAHDSIFEPLVKYEAKDMAVVTINTGGVPGQTGFVKLDGTVNVAAGGCPCGVGWLVTRDEGGNSSPQYASTNGGYLNGAVTWVVAVPTGTTQTFRLKVAFDGGTSASAIGRGDLSAIYAPFGSMGTSALTAQPAGEELPATPPDHQPELLAPLTPEPRVKRRDLAR